MCAHISAGRSWSASNPILIKLPKSRITAHLHSFSPLFPHLWNKLPHSSIPLFPRALQNSCSPPPLIFPNPKPRSFLPPLLHPKPTPFIFTAFLPESPCSVHLLYRVYIALPSTDLLMCLFPTVLCFPLPPSCLLFPLLYVLCVSSHTSLGIVYIK